MVEPVAPSSQPENLENGNILEELPTPQEEAPQVLIYLYLILLLKNIFFIISRIDKIAKVVILTKLILKIGIQTEGQYFNKIFFLLFSHKSSDLPIGKYLIIHFKLPA